MYTVILFITDFDRLLGISENRITLNARGNRLENERRRS